MLGPKAAKTFSFLRRSFDPLSGSARLVYRVDDGPELVEQLLFPYTPWPSDASRQLAFDHALELYTWLLGSATGRQVWLLSWNFRWALRHLKSLIF